MRILLINQAFHPDVVSSGQHLTDLAQALARDHSVTVLTSATGYDDPAARYPRSEVWRGIRIQRIWFPRWSKRFKVTRALDFLGFLAGATLKLAVAPRADAVVAMTSPPLISVLAALFVRIRGGRLILWVMDLNPDESVAAGWLAEDSWVTRGLQRLLRFSLKTAATAVTLDRFMAARIAAKGVATDAIRVVPPWSHADVAFDAEGRERFRAEHGLEPKFVVMYAGNHSPCHPLQTLLEAALALRTDTSIAFCFIGGGSAAADVTAFARDHQLENIIRVPYQPREQLSAAISAGDLHVVVLGDPFVGTVHPCKVYNLLRVGARILYIGPPQSHISDIARAAPDEQIVTARHGDVAAAVEAIRAARVRGFKPSAPLDGPYEASVHIPVLVTLIESAQLGAITATEMPYAGRDASQ